MTSVRDYGCTGCMGDESTGLRVDGITDVQDVWVTVVRVTGIRDYGCTGLRVTGERGDECMG